MYGSASARIFALSAAEVPVRAMDRRAWMRICALFYGTPKENGRPCGPPSACGVKPAAFAVRIQRLLDGDALRLRRGLLRQCQLEHAVGVPGLDGAFLDGLVERKGAIDLAVVALGA